MKIRLRQPLALFSFLALILLTGLSVVSSVLEVRLTNRLAGDAAAINLSGTLRMQSYQLAYAIEKKTPLFERQSLVRDFETRLNAPTLAGQIATAPSALQSQFDLVQHRFQIMKAAALNDPPAYLRAVDGFVDELDELVGLLERWSADKVSRVRRIQLRVSLFSFLCASTLAWFLIKFAILPVQKLLHAVKQMGSHNQPIAVSFTGFGEVGELSRAFNKMVQELAAVHLSQETTIRHQTEALTRNNRVLEFLFSLSQTLNAEQPPIQALKEKAADDLQSLFAEKSVYWTVRKVLDNTNRVAYECVFDGSHLVCTGLDPLEPWQHQTLITVVELFNNALNRLDAHKIDNRIALLNERSSMARELHDSLAQSLSYLKIQVARWLALRERGAEMTSLDAIAIELRDGLSTTYRKLRELLVTFRSTSGELGLVPSITAAVAEVNRLGHRTSVHLHIDDNWPEDLSPSQEIHCLHIVREAMSNTLKHAQANNAVVSLQNRLTFLEISITDDGVGFGDTLAEMGQFGLQIMTERALRIGGRIEYQTLQAGGASVLLCFNAQPDNQGSLLIEPYPIEHGEPPL